MSLINCSGVVIKTNDLGENDKLITIYTDKLGKIACVAKGARKSKSKNLAIALPFSYCNYTVFKGRNLYTISEAKVIDSFQNFLNSFDNLTYGSYFCELIDISMVAEESNIELFKTFVTALYLLKTNALDVELLARAFELKLLSSTGYGLSFDRCSICNNKMENSTFISYQYVGGVCNKCNKIFGKEISMPAYNTLKFLNNISMDKVYRINPSEAVKKELKEVLSKVIASNYARRPISLDILDFC